MLRLDIIGAFSLLFFFHIVQLLDLFVDLLGFDKLLRSLPFIFAIVIFVLNLPRDGGVSRVSFKLVLLEAWCHLAVWGALVHSADG